MSQEEKDIKKTEEIETMGKDGIIIGDIEKEGPITIETKKTIITIEEDQEDTEIEEIFAKLEERTHELK